MPDPSSQGPGGLGQSAVIKQDATTLTVTRTTQRGGDEHLQAGRSESKNTLNIRGNAIDQLSKVKWDGGAEGRHEHELRRQSVNVTIAMSLDASGNLIVVSTRPGFQGSGAVTTKAT